MLKTLIFLFILPIILLQGADLITIVDFWKNADKEDGARYLNYQQRQDLKIIVHNGKLYTGKEEELDTHLLPNGETIFVLAQDGNMYIASDWKPILFEQSAMVSEESVYCAGFITIHYGELKRISDYSAMYITKNKDALNGVLTKLKEMGVSLEDVKVSYNVK